MEKNLNTTKPHYSEHIFPVPWTFVISMFHCPVTISSLWFSFLPAPSSAIYQGYRNLLVSFGSSLDLNCGAPNIFQPLIFLEIIRMDGITQLTPDGHRVTLTGRTVTIHGLDHSMRGRVVCKVISSCNQAQKDVDLGHLLPVPPKGTKHFLST